MIIGVVMQMLSRFSRSLLLGLAVAALLAAAGCGRGKAPAQGGGVSAGGAQGGRQAAQAPRDGGTLRIGLWDKPSGLFNPLFTDDPADAEVNRLLFESLLRFGPDLSLQPNLARRFTVAADQKTITFELRDDVRWHDGRPLTADDVAFTIRLALNPDYRGPYRDRFLAIQGAREYQAGKAGDLAGVRIAGPLTLVVTMEQPYGPLLTRLAALPVLPRHVFLGMAVKDIAAAPPSRRSPVGSGPFRLTAFNPGDKGDIVVLSRFDSFFRGRPHLDRVAFAVLGRRPTVESLRAAGIDVLRLHPAAVGAVQATKSYNIYEVPSGGYFYLGVNLGWEPLDEKPLRQALAYALDRRNMVRSLFAGYGTLVNSPVFPGSWAEAKGLQVYDEDLDKARRLLAAAGFKDEDGDGVVSLKGKDLALNLIYIKGKPFYADLAALIRQDLQQAGIKVYLVPLEQKDFMLRVFRRRQFDLYLLDWEIELDPDPEAVFGEKALGNAVGFRSGQALLAKGVGTVSPEQRRPIYEHWTRLVNEELPYIFLFTGNKILAADRRVRDLVFSPPGILDAPEKWWVEPVR